MVIITLLIYSGIHPSPKIPNLSEWDACKKPLGAWNSIWLVRVVLGCIVSYWGFKRERAQRIASVPFFYSFLDDITNNIHSSQERRESGQDIELGRPSHTNPMALPSPPGGSSGRAGSLGPVRASPRSSTTIGATAEGQGSGQINLPHSYLYSRQVPSLFVIVSHCSMYYADCHCSRRYYPSCGSLLRIYLSTRLSTHADSQLHIYGG